MENTVSSGILASAVTSNMLQGVLNELLSLLPIILPVMITFIGIRKGISFITNTLQSA